MNHRSISLNKEILAQSDVVVPPVVEISTAIWPQTPPTLTVEELLSRVAEPAVKK